MKPTQYKGKIIEKAVETGKIVYIVKNGREVKGEYLGTIDYGVPKHPVFYIESTDEVILGRECYWSFNPNQKHNAVKIGGIQYEIMDDEEKIVQMLNEYGDKKPSINPDSMFI